VAIRKVYIGSLGPIIYDDTEPIGHLGYGADELDPDFVGIPRAAIVTDGDIYGNIGTVAGLTVAISTVTGDYTLDISSDAVLLVDAVGGEITITLPTAVGIEGRIFWVKKIDSSRNKVVLDGYGSETIEDELTQELLWKGDSPMMISDNAEWWFI